MTVIELSFYCPSCKKLTKHGVTVKHNGAATIRCKECGDKGEVRAQD